MWFPDRLRGTVWRCRAMVWIAGLLVPDGDRVLWRTSQNRHYWHWCHFLAESGQLTVQNRVIIARSCWRLFPTAFWLRFDREGFLTRVRRLQGSPLTLVAGAALLALVLVLLSGIVPSIRAAYSAPVPQSDRTVLVTLEGSGINGKFSRTRSDTLLDLASVWSKSKLAEGIAAFSWGPANLLLPRRDLQIPVARVGPTFFATLGQPAEMGRVFTPRDVEDCSTCVLLSHAAWQDNFHSDPNIIGKPIDVNGTAHAVIGVLPASFHVLSPGVAVWELIDPAILFTNFQRRVGAVGRLRDGSAPEQLQRELSDLTESAGYVHPSSQLQVITIATQTKRELISTIWFVLLITGCAMLVVVLRHLSNGLGKLPEGASTRWKWLGFFVAKSTLLLLLVALVSWCVVHWLAYWLVGSSYPLVDEYSIWLFLPLAVVALSWSVRDQQQRCRVCLCRLELPVEIGRTGSVLLNWAGTEMVCPAGHGVLYLPESPANSLDQGRWNNLDQSWEDLFRAG